MGILRDRQTAANTTPVEKGQRDTKTAESMGMQKDGHSGYYKVVERDGQTAEKTGVLWDGQTAASKAVKLDG